MGSSKVNQQEVVGSSEVNHKVIIRSICGKPKVVSELVESRNRKALKLYVNYLDQKPALSAAPYGRSPFSSLLYFSKKYGSLHSVIHAPFGFCNSTLRLPMVAIAQNLSVGSFLSLIGFAISAPFFGFVPHPKKCVSRSLFFAPLLVASGRSRSWPICSKGHLLRSLTASRPQ